MKVVIVKEYGAVRIGVVAGGSMRRLVSQTFHRTNRAMTKDLIEAEFDRIIKEDDSGFMKLMLYKVRKQFIKDVKAQERLILESRAIRLNEK